MVKRFSNRQKDFPSGAESNRINHRLLTKQRTLTGKDSDYYELVGSIELSPRVSIENQSPPLVSGRPSTILMPDIMHTLMAVVFLGCIFAFCGLLFFGFSLEMAAIGDFEILDFVGQNH